MKRIVFYGLCGLALLAFPASARSHRRGLGNAPSAGSTTTWSSPGTGFSPTMPFGTPQAGSGSNSGFSPSMPFGAPAAGSGSTSGYSPSSPFMDTPNRTVNVSSGGPRGFGRQRGRRGYYGGYGDSRQNFNNGIPGYNSSQPEKAPPGY